MSVDSFLRSALECLSRRSALTEWARSAQKCVLTETVGTRFPFRQVLVPAAGGECDLPVYMQ